jgi:GalNAc-alpha-(1->4)-GalNAc-alpha-(1->3)-diNAcBac-PP-undecaprenol alpha-1,4-N-acetyl-D-galactosaminyltransferase
MLVKELGISDKVEFIGESKNVESYYLKSKIFAFTSIVEGFPTVLGEALSAGLACISYNCHSGASDLIKNDDNGYLVKINNKLEYKNKLEILLESDNLRKRFIDKSTLKIRDFDLEIISNKYYNFLLSHENSN